VVGNGTKFFIGSCILAAGLVVKAGAPLVPVAGGLLLAGILTWLRHRRAKTSHS
jgi:hypothetical protein